jgi:hypothetical protein
VGRKPIQKLCTEIKVPYLMKACRKKPRIKTKRRKKKKVNIKELDKLKKWQSRRFFKGLWHA